MNNNDLGVPASPSGHSRAEPEEVSALRASVPNAWPDELTPELADILGRQCFTFIHLATTYRLAGYEIPTRAEAEQAYFLHKMVGAWFRHGAGWVDALTDELREVHALAAKALEARGEA